MSFDTFIYTLSYQMYWNKSSLLDDPRPIMECIPEHLSHRDKMAERILMTLNTDTEHYEYTSLFSSQWKKEFYDIETRYDCCLSLLSDVNPIFLTNGIQPAHQTSKQRGRKPTSCLQCPFYCNSSFSLLACRYLSYPSQLLVAVVSISPDNNK